VNLARSGTPKLSLIFGDEGNWLRLHRRCRPLLDPAPAFIFGGQLRIVLRLTIGGERISAQLSPLGR
jgi:hypothetical protein